MNKILEVAKRRANLHGTKNVIVPTSDTGRTVKRAQEIFGPGYDIFAVGNPTTSKERGLCLHKGTSEAKRKELEAMGMNVVLADRSFNQGLGPNQDYRPLVNGKFFDVWKEPKTSAPLDEWIENISMEGIYNVVGLVTRSFLWFGEGGKVCLECMLIAADSGRLPLDQLCISIATPVDPEVPDVCMTLWPARTEEILTSRFGVVDIAQVPKE